MRGQAGRKQHPSPRALELLEQGWSGSPRLPHVAHCTWSVAPTGRSRGGGCRTALCVSASLLDWGVTSPLIPLPT